MLGDGGVPLVHGDGHVAQVLLDLLVLAAGDALLALARTQELRDGGFMLLEEVAHPPRVDVLQVGHHLDVGPERQVVLLLRLTKVLYVIKPG